MCFNTMMKLVDKYYIHFGVKEKMAGTTTDIWFSIIIVFFHYSNL